MFAPRSHHANAAVRAKATLKADFSVASIEGYLGFDALFYFTPTFHFTISVDFGVSVRAFGQNLAAVAVHMQLEGPGEWARHRQLLVLRSVLGQDDPVR